MEPRTDAFLGGDPDTGVPKIPRRRFKRRVEAGADALVQQLSLETSEAERRAAAAASNCNGTAAMTRRQRSDSW